MFRATKFYKWRQRFLRRNPEISGPKIKGRSLLVLVMWKRYNQRILNDAIYEYENGDKDIILQVPGKDFRE